MKLKKKTHEDDERKVKIHVSPTSGVHRLDADEFIRTDVFKEFDRKFQAKLAHLKQS